jgi:hypothetical protein
MDEHFAARAAFLAALPPHDVERQTAERHVAWCLRCRAAFNEAKQLVFLLKEALAPTDQGTPQWLQRPRRGVRN